MNYISKFTSINLLIYTLLFCSFSYAQINGQILMMPSLGFEFGSLNQDDNTTAKIDQNINGPIGELKIGGSFTWIEIGMSIELGQLSAETNPGSQFHLSQTKYDQTNLGLYLGFYLPPSIRTWITIVPQAKIEQTSSQGIDSKSTEYDGNGFKFGVGINLIEHVALSLEYKALSYDEKTFGDTQETLSLNENPLKEEVFILGLSFPFLL